MIKLVEISRRKESKGCIIDCYDRGVKARGVGGGVGGGGGGEVGGGSLMAHQMRVHTI